MRAWQIDKIRRAIHSYQALRSVNGKTYSLRQVLDDIPAGHGPDLELEAFRRFCVGKSRSFEPPQKINDIIEFLCVEEMLDPADLTDDEAHFAEGVRVHNALAALGKDVICSHEALNEEYMSDGAEDVLSFTLAVEPPGTLLWVEETVGRAGKAQSSLKEHGVLHFFRKGYGMSIGREPSLNFFLRGADPLDVVHYVLLRQRSSKGEAIAFVRSGDAGEGTGSMPEADFEGIALFQSVSSRKAPIREMIAVAASAPSLDFESLTTERG